MVSYLNSSTLLAALVSTVLISVPQEAVRASGLAAPLSFDNSIPSSSKSRVLRVQATTSSRETLSHTQRLMKRMGIYNGAIDGIWGPRTENALIAMFNRAGELFSNRRYKEAERLYRHVLTAGQIGWGDTHNNTLSVLNNLANSLNGQERNDEVIEINRKVLEIRQRKLGPEHPDTLSSASNLAAGMNGLGQYVEAETMLRHWIPIQERVMGPEHRMPLSSLAELANSLRAQGRYAEAEALHRQVYRARKRVLGSENSDTLGSLVSVANSIYSQGQFVRAEVIYREALTLHENAFGSENYDTLRVKNNLAASLIQQERYAEAERLQRRVLEIGERKFGMTDPVTLSSASKLGSSLAKQGKHSEAEPLLRRAVTGQTQTVGSAQFTKYVYLGSLAESISAQGRYGEAILLYRRALTALERELGSGHPRVVNFRNELALALVAQGKRPEALAAWEKAMAVLPEYFQLGATAEVEERVEQLPLDLVRYLEVLRGSDSDDQAKRSFVAQGWLSFGATDFTVSDVVSRQQTNATESALALRAYQDVRDQLQRLRRNYLDGFNADAKMTRTARDRMEADLRATEDRFAKISQQIERDFPALAELELPRALRAEEAQGLLEPGEGLLAYVSSEEHLYAWLVTSEGITWRRMKASRAELTERVAHLRASLDIDWRAPPPEIAPGCKLVSSNPDLADWPFDLCAAQELQEIVLDDLDLSGIEELIVVPDGPLESLPFAMLVTDREDDGRPRWLIEDHAITTLPTTSSLRALRHGNGATGADNRLPFLGLAPVEFDTTSPDSALRGSPLATLPGTADEVRLLSGLLGAGRDGTVIGSAASEAFSKSTPLDRYRVLSFATHGLLSREAAEVTDGNISEMSLALTAGNGEDGLLTASEVAGLRLDADWVLLSACNTAGGDGDDAQGLSGLARAFFFAGARALMVSHWYIDDAATSQLMAATMERSSNDGETSRAQALRQAQLAMLSQRNHAHPFYWAPFSVVGDNRSQNAVDVNLLTAKEGGRVPRDNLAQFQPDRTFSAATEETENGLQLSRNDRRAIQHRLSLVDHDPGGADGVFGPQTRTAISDWQTSQGLPPSGYLSDKHLDALKSQSEASYQEFKERTPKKKTKRVRVCKRGVLGVLYDCRYEWR